MIANTDQNDVVKARKLCKKAIELCLHSQRSKEQEGTLFRALNEFTDVLARGVVELPEGVFDRLVLLSLLCDVTTIRVGHGIDKDGIIKVLEALQAFKNAKSPAKTVKKIELGGTFT